MSYVETVSANDTNDVHSGQVLTVAGDCDAHADGHVIQNTSQTSIDVSVSVYLPTS